MKKKAIFLIALALCASFSLSAATLTVCASGCDHTTIQAAINAASSGDVIDIQYAVHTEDSIYIDKNLTIQGQGQTSTIVQAAAMAPANKFVVGMAEDGVFVVNQGLTVLFQDLTIRHGNVLRGELNFSDGGGGVKITCNRFSDVSFERVSITNNRAQDDGGGVYIDGLKGKVHFTDCVISDNQASTSGIDANGGGIINDGALDFKMIRCTVTGNRAGEGGGGLFLVKAVGRAAYQFINCTIANNRAGGAAVSHSGGGIYVTCASTIDIINCTIVNNEVRTGNNRAGGGIYWTEGGHLTLINSIVANNTGASGPNRGNDIWDNSFGGTMTITTSLVEDCDACGATPTYTSDPNLATATPCGVHTYFLPESPSDAIGNGTAPAGDIPTDDICGNTRDATYDLGSVDPELVPPTALCQDISVSLDDNGMASIAPSDIDNGSRPGITSRSASPTTFGCNDIGPNTVTLTVTNVIGTASCTANVQITNTPTAICTDITVSLDDNGMATIVASEVNAGSSDACGGVTLSASPTTFGCNNIGPNTVTLTVTNGNSSTDDCAANVQITNANPKALCKDITVSLDDNGMATIVASEVNDGSSDACGGVSLVASTTSFGCNEIGPNTVTLTVTNGNSATDDCTANVQITNTPTAICTDITLSLDNNGLAAIVASEINDGSSDACGGVSLHASPTSFGCNEIGPNTVTLTVTNGNAATDDCTANVQITNTPTALCQDATVCLDANGDGAIAASDIDDGSSDACGVPTLNASVTTFECSNLGSNTVTLTVTNGNAATASCTANVEVQDKIAPTINCPTNILRRNTDPGVCTHTIVGTDLDPLPIDDNCTVASIVNDYNGQNSLGGEVLPKGKTTVTWTVTDQSGNSTPCTYDIRIRDREAPIFDNCPDDANLLVPFCTPGIVHNWPPITATDNCTNASKLVFSPAILSGSTFPVGTTTVSIDVTDKAGNTENCSFDVNVTEVCDPLPAGMYNEDIGNTGGVVGKVCYDAATKTYEMKTSGSGIPSVMSNIDGFHYVKLQTNAPTMDLIARVVNHPTNSNRDRVGVMIREHSYGSNPSAANVATLIAGDNRTYMTNRAMGGSFTTVLSGPILPGPLWPGPVYWVRLQRVGFSFTASVSPNGSSWTPIGTMSSFIMPAYGSGNYDVGIVGTAGNPGTSVHYTIDNVTINGTAYRLGENGLEPLTVAAFPNPTRDRLNVQLAAPAFSEVALTLSNAVGQKLLVERFEATEGMLERQLDVSEFAAGVYLLEVRTATESKTIKIRKF